MTNERLRNALSRAGLTYDDVSQRLGVDPKTVERWVTKGRRPHRETRLKLAALVGEDEALLWPGTESDPRTTAASEAELVTFYPNRGSVPIDTWIRLAEQATECIDLLAYGGTFLHDALPDFSELLIDRVEHGVMVRLLFGDADSDAVELRGEEEGIGTALADRCSLTWKYLQPVVGRPGVEARAHGSTLYNSIYRFDDTALVNTHTLGAPAVQNPVLEFRRIAGGRIFRHYMASFERTWDQARPL